MANKLDITTIQTAEDMRKIDVSAVSTKALPQSIYHVIAASADRFGGKIALKYILDGDCLGPNKIPFSKKVTHQLLKVIKGRSFANPYREISYRTLASSVTQIGNALHHLGINRTDVTSILLPNFPEMYFSLWGAESVGIANPINPLLDANIIKEIITTAKSKVIIALGPVPGSDIWTKTLAIKDDIPGLVAVISLFGDDIPATNGQSVPVYSFEKLMAKQDSKILHGSLPNQRDVCSYFHTGGTTGLPKLAKHLHLNELSNAAQVNLISPVTSDDTMLIGLPIFHVNAAIATGLASVMLGSTILMAGPSGFRGNNVIKNLLTIIDNFSVAFMTAVPTVYAGLLEHINNNVEVKKPASMKLALVGAAPLSPDLQKKFTHKTGIQLVEGYGSTEGTAVSTLMPVNAINQQASVGLTMPTMTLSIGEVDNEGQLKRLCDVDEVGEILIAGNNVFPGYVDDSHNEKLWVTTEAGEKLVRTGDLGKQDANGYLALCGRQKELIIRGGHNIDPKMIEDIASAHPDVFLAAAIPRPDSYAGELPVLYVTTKENSLITAESLLEYMKHHVPERAAIPKQVHILAEMPLTAVGKLFKPELICREIKSVLLAELSELFSKGIVEVKVVPDKKQGVMATIKVFSDKQDTLAKIKAQLTAYTFSYKLVVSEHKRESA